MSLRAELMHLTAGQPVTWAEPTTAGVVTDTASQQPATAIALQCPRSARRTHLSDSEPRMPRTRLRVERSAARKYGSRPPTLLS